MPATVGINPPLLPRILQQTPAHSRFFPAPAAHVQRQLHPRAALGREKKGPGGSLLSEGLVGGQRVPHLPPVSRVGLSCCSASSQPRGGWTGQAALLGQAEQLLGQLLVPHHLQGQTKRRELLKSPSGQHIPAAPVCAPGRHPSLNQVLILVLSPISRDNGDFLLPMEMHSRQQGNSHGMLSLCTSHTQIHTQTLCQP